MPRASDGRCIWCERELPPASRVLLVELLEALDDMDRDNDELLEWLLSDYRPRIRAFLERRPEPTRERDTGGAGAGFQGPMLSGETIGRLADDPDYFARLLEPLAPDDDHRSEPGQPRTIDEDDRPDSCPLSGQVYGDEL